MLKALLLTGYFISVPTAALAPAVLAYGPGLDAAPSPRPLAHRSMLFDMAPMSMAPVSADRILPCEAIAVDRRGDDACTGAPAAVLAAARPVRRAAGAAAERL